MTSSVRRRYLRVLVWGLFAASVFWLAFGTLGIRPARADTPSPVPTSVASAPQPDGSTTGASDIPSASESGTPSPSGASAGPTDRELLAAVTALAAGAVLGGMVIALVRRVNEIQATLARRALARGQSVSTQIGPAAGGDERLLEGEPGGQAAAEGPPPIAITGPDEVGVGATAEYTATGGEETALIWTVSGLSSYERTQTGPRTVTVTPKSPGEGTVSLTDGTLTGSHALKVVPEPTAVGGFQLQLAIRNWGLIVVAIGIVFGAIALGLAGILDGAQFISLIAPLAALLGVTAAAGRSSSGGGT